MKKQVLRYRDENGKKYFRQRRPGKGGYVWNVSGLPPMLFNRDLLGGSDTVVIVEGEKDGTNVTDLGLNGRYGRVIGTTSGGSESWDGRLADGFSEGKRVVILPDDDAAGERYADAVEQSLKARGIEYRRVSFDGTGCKDVSEYLKEHSVEDLVRLMGIDWIAMPDGTWLQDPDAEQCDVSQYDCEEILI